MGFGMRTVARAPMTATRRRHRSKVGPELHRVSSIPRMVSVAPARFRSPRTYCSEVGRNFWQEAQRGHQWSSPKAQIVLPMMLVVGDVVQVLQLVHRRLAVEDLPERHVEPRRAFAARGALTTRLVVIELHQVLHRQDRVGPRPSRSRSRCRARPEWAAEGRPRAARRAPTCRAGTFVQGRLLVRRAHDLVRAKDRGGRAAGDHGEERLVVDDAAADVVNQLGCSVTPTASLDDLRLLHVPVHAEEALSRLDVVEGAEGREFAAPSHRVVTIAIVPGCSLSTGTEGPRLRRERRLDPRLAALPRAS